MNENIICAYFAIKKLILSVLDCNICGYLSFSNQIRYHFPLGSTTGLSDMTIRKKIFHIHDIDLGEVMIVKMNMINMQE